MLDKQNEVDFTMPATYYNFSNYMLITITMVIVTMIMVLSMKKRSNGVI